MRKSRCTDGRLRGEARRPVQLERQPVLRRRLDKLDLAITMLTLVTFVAGTSKSIGRE